MFDVDGWLAVELASLQSVGCVSTHRPERLHFKWCVRTHPASLIVITLEQTLPFSFMTEFAVKGLIYDAIED